MKILVNTDGFAPLGGVELSTLQVSAQLAARGHACHLLHCAPTSGGLEPIWRGFASSVTKVPGFTVAAARPWKTLHHLPSSIRAAQHVRPEVVYLNRAEQMLWAVAAARSSHAGLVVHLRHHPFPSAAVRALGRGRTRYIAVSRFIADRWVEAGLHPDAVEVVPNGIDPEAYAPPTLPQRLDARAMIGVLDERLVVVCYGRLSVEKGIHSLLEAWSRIHRGRPDATLVLAGDADHEIIAMAATRGHENVRLVPRRDDVTGLLHAADLVVLPAGWQEPFGRVVIEALSAEVPVVATRVGGIPEILTGPFADHLVGAGDTVALAETVARLASWRVDRPGLGAAGRRHVRQHFTLARTVDRVESVLRASAEPAHRAERLVA